MTDTPFKKMCLEKPYTPLGYTTITDMPFYNPDGCCEKDGEYIVYESESSSNKKAHVGAFLEACFAAEQKNASLLRMFFIQKERGTNIAIHQFPRYFSPYVEFMRSKLPDLTIEVYVATDLTFEGLKHKGDSILDLLNEFICI